MQWKVELAKLMTLLLFKLKFVQITVIIILIIVTENFFFTMVIITKQFNNHNILKISRKKYLSQR